MAFPPTPTLTIANCPAVKSYSGVHDPATEGVLTSTAYLQGATLSAASLNADAARDDVGDRIGGGIWGIVPGSAGTDLNLSIGSGLTLNVAEGLAQMDGPVYRPATSVVLTANISRVWLWMSQAGAIVQVNNSLTPPAGAHVLMGSAVTGASTITSVDFSGVLYLQGTHAFRFNSGSGLPTDTPPSNVSFEQIQTGDGSLWLWTGSAWYLVSSGSSSVSQATVSVTGNQTLTAGQAAANALLLNDAGVSDIFTLTWPSGVTAGQTWFVRNNTGEGARLTYTGGANYVYLQDQQCVIVEWDGTELREGGRGLPRYLTGVDWTVTGTKTYLQFEEIEGDLISFALNGDTTVNFPTAGALGNKGRRIAIENGDTGADVLRFRTNGAGGDEADFWLMPGQMKLGTIDGAGGWNELPTRPRMRFKAITHDDTANYTAVHPDFLAYFIDVTGTLTADRNLILPNAADNGWVIRNSTVKTITVKTPAGTGVAIGAKKIQPVFCDGTNMVVGGSISDILTSAFQIVLSSAQTASTTVGGTSAETSLTGTELGTRVIPAGWFQPGRTVRLTARGHLSTDATTPATLNLRVKFGSTTLATTGDQTPAAALASRYWEVSVLITCRTTGATGTVFAQGAFTHAPSAAGSAVIWDMENSSPSTVDTTGTLTADLTADWGGTDVDDTITLTNLLTELLG